MGMVILGAFALYLLVSIIVVLLAARAAKIRGRSSWRWGGGAALTMYLLLFWDHIPTLIAHKYYCEKEGGFWVYKTAAQWKIEHPSVAQTLKPSSSAVSSEFANIKAYQIYRVNDRILWRHEVTNAFLTVRRYDDTLRDTRSNEILAREVRFQSGRCSGPPKSISDLKFWLNQCRCQSSSVPFINDQGLSWSQVYKEFANVGGQ